jgi:3-hydroxyacyl-[acyl-carrier-protein] dehydratase
MTAEAEDAGEITALNAEQIQKLLPHRYPFLLVDRIEQIRGDEFCVGIKNVTVNEPFFPGHFPGRPVMPGVLLLEGMAQTAGAICALARQGLERKHGVVFFLSVDKARFRRPVVPGDQVEFHMTKLKQRGTWWWFSGESKVGGRVVCEAELGAMIAEE